MNDASPIEIPPPFDEAKMQLLLTQLKQLEASEGISWWPLATGWWFLIVIAAIGLVLVTKQFIIYLHIKKQQAQLLEEYLHIASNYHDSNEQLTVQQKNRQYINDLNQLLRRAVMLSLPREQIANCRGQQWLSILKYTPVVIADEVAFTLLTACYQPDPNIDIEALDSFAQQWFAQQHPKHYKQELRDA